MEETLPRSRWSNFAWTLVLGAAMAAGGVAAAAAPIPAPDRASEPRPGDSAPTARFEGGGQDGREGEGFEPLWSVGQKEWGVLTGVSTGTVLRVVRAHTSALHVRLRWAVHSGAWGPGFLRGNAAIVFEILPLLAVDQEPRAYGTGFGVYLRHTVQGRRLRPYIFGGSGVLGATTDIPDGEYPFNFETQGGVGVQYRLRPRTAVAIEYRFDHISNAGIGHDNPGINSHVALVGISWY